MKSGTMRRRLLAGIFLGLHTAASIACPPNADLTSRDLLGLWRAEFEGGRESLTVLLEPNPEWPGSFAGRFTQGGRTVQVAGDLEDGTFTLEESADGVRIDATWAGQPVDGSCGREIRGSWRATGREAPRSFVLRRTSGW